MNPRLVWTPTPNGSWDVVNQLRGNGVSVALTTHLMDDVEQLANKVAASNNGKVVACGSPK